MKDFFNGAKWIWTQKEGEKNSYGEFFSFFKYYGGNLSISISADSDYALFLNGKFVCSNQYGDYKHYKIYDTVDLSGFAKVGENKLAVLVWYFGEDSMRYKLEKAGVIFSVNANGQTLLISDEKTLARQSLGYKNGYAKKITAQLGFSYFYDATKDDDWINGNGAGFNNSVVIEKDCEFFPRPIKLLSLGEFVKGKMVLNDENKSFILDLGAETVGLLKFNFYSSISQKVVISWGEHLDDKFVRRQIKSRDFSVEYNSAVGRNEYVNYLLRFGARYLQFDFEQPVSDFVAGLIPQNYPCQLQPITYVDDEIDDVYKVCVKTLELCMMEHYVDCPWREQCLYAFDSRNQMLCGYYAFKDGNKEYARANLKLMSMDRRDDGLMSICYPCGTDLTIPSFSLYYVLAVKEYVDHTGDVSLFLEVYDKINEILTTFNNNVIDGIACKFGGVNHWNFYDWSKFSEGTLMIDEEPLPDFIVNALFVTALDCFELLCEKARLPFNFYGVKETIKANATEKFFNKEKGLFSLDGTVEKCTELVNSLAIYSGIANKEQKAVILDLLSKGELVPCSLSMKFFKYEVLTDSGNKDYILSALNEMKSTYKNMLDKGATAVWETEDGADAFDKAGSLCHGWSAVPVYFYHKLGLVKKIEN